MSLPRLLDLYCGAGAASMGYHQAGFEVVGFDLNPQPSYPFRLIQGDVTKLKPENIVGRFHAIHASPPCQRYTTANRADNHLYPDLIDQTRDLLEATGLPWVIENVMPAPLRDPVVLCGSSFGLRVRRHRKFEANFPIMELPCEHEWQDRHKVYEGRVTRGRGGIQKTGVVPVYGHGQMKSNHELSEIAMGIDWMIDKRELTNAIPPAFTRHVGRYAMLAVRKGT